MKNEFPSEFDPERTEGPGNLPPQIAAIVGQMFRDERPDSRELEWANVLSPHPHDAEGMSMENARVRILAYLNEGYALNQKLKIKDGIIYWQGARLKKPEGE